MYYVKENDVFVSGPLGYDGAVGHRALLAWRGYKNLSIVDDMPGRAPWVMPEDEWAREYLKWRNKQSNGI